MFNSSQWFNSKGSAADTKAPDFEYEQDCPKGMQASPTEGLQGRDDAGAETTHAHSYVHVHAHTPTRAHIRTHKCTQTCVHRFLLHANTQRYMHAHAHVHVCMQEPQHVCKCTHTHCTHARKFVFCTHTHVHTQIW